MSLVFGRWRRKGKQFGAGKWLYQEGDGEQTQEGDGKEGKLKTEEKLFLSGVRWKAAIEGVVKGPIII